MHASPRRWPCRGATLVGVALLLGCGACRRHALPSPDALDTPVQPARSTSRERLDVSADVRERCAWLARRQRADGAWHDVETTARVLLAQIACAEIGLGGARRACPAGRAVDFLLSRVGATGTFAAAGEPHPQRACALATLALAEYWGVTGERRLRPVLPRVLASAVRELCPGASPAAAAEREPRPDVETLWALAAAWRCMKAGDLADESASREALLGSLERGSEAARGRVSDDDARTAGLRPEEADALVASARALLCDDGGRGAHLAAAPLPLGYPPSWHPARIAVTRRVSEAALWAGPRTWFQWEARLIRCMDAAPVFDAAAADASIAAASGATEAALRAEVVATTHALQVEALFFGPLGHVHFARERDDGD